jgi:2-methylcitrate dehydratase PrpD
MGKVNAAFLDTLSAFACDTALQDLPAAVIERARWVVADCLAVIAAGMQAPEMKALAGPYLAGLPSSGVWVIGAGRRARRFDAAFLNGAAGTWFELDEGNVHSSGHPAIQLVPAAIAYSQEEEVSGADLLAATVLGYEVCSRIARAAKMRTLVHPHGTWGVIGAAVAVGKLAALNREQMRSAINIAATMAMTTSYGTLREGATVRNIYTGHSNMAGQQAVLLAQSGFTGEADAVSTIYGSLLAESFDARRTVEGLGSDWLYLQSYFKLHPTGRALHSAIDALEDALKRAPGGRIDTGEVERIELIAYRKTAVMAQKDVTSSFGAKFSVPFALATIIHHGRSGLQSFGDEAVANAQIQSLCQRVQMSENPAYTAQYPQRQLCDVTVVLRNGQKLVGRSETMKGEPSNPHSVAELEQKYRELATPIWGEALASKVLEDCMRLEKIADFRAYSAQFEL